MNEEKRKISIGFKKPSVLEGDIIYVTFTNEFDTVASAVSKEEFNYSGRSIAGNVVDETTREISGRVGMRGYARDYRAVIKELVEKNNGDEDWSRAIKEGIKAYDGMRNLLR